MIAIRLLAAVAAAVGVTFGLFWVMTALIVVEGDPPSEKPRQTIGWVDVRRDTPVEVTKRLVRPVRRNVLEEPWQRPHPPSDRSGPGVFESFEPLGPASDEGHGERGPRLLQADGDAVPLVRVPPRYPERALARGLEGRVLVEFTVDALGNVIEARAVAWEPSPAFNQAAVEAVRQWRYSPRIVDGRAVEQRGLRVSIPFRREAARDAS